MVVLTIKVWRTRNSFGTSYLDLILVGIRKIRNPL
jgi:hypothetical protein